MHLKPGQFKRCSLSKISSLQLLENVMPERGLGYQMTPASSILYLFQIRLESNIQWCKFVLHAPDPCCSGASFWHFPSGSRFPHWRQQRSQTIILWESLATWPNINVIGLNERCLQKQTPAWNCTCWCKLQALFKFSTSFSEMLQKLELRIMHFQQHQNILNFVFLIYFVYIWEIVPLTLQFRS